MASLALTFDLLVRDAASAAFRNAGNAAGRAGQQTSALGNAAKAAGAALLTGGLIQGLQSLYEAAAESQRIGRLTEQVIKTTGQAAGVSAKQVGDLAGAIAAKTGVDDEAIQSGANLLLTFTNIKNAAGEGNDIFNQTTQIMTDMSAALGKDASGSAIQLGKALNDPIKGITALSKAGVSFTQQQKDQIKTFVESGDILSAQKVILEELGKEFGGAAEAASTPLDKLKVRAGNLAETLGNYLVPIVDNAAQFFDRELLPALEKMAPVFGVIIDGVVGLAGVIGDVVSFFAGLPGPVLLGVGALVAFNVLSPLVVKAAGSIAFAWGVMTASIAASTGAIAVARGALGGLVGFLGGPWALAIGAVAVGLGFLFSAFNDNDEAAENAAAATEGYAEALRQANGAIDENVRMAAAKAAQDSGLLDMTDKLGISAAVVTDAITKQGGALESVQARLQSYADQQTTTVVDANGQVTVSISEQGQAALDLIGTLTGLAGQSGATRSDLAQLAEATGTGGASMQTFAQQIEAARTELNEGQQAIDDFKLSLDILTGQTVSLIEVEASFQAAVASAKDAVKDLSGEVLNSAGQLNVQSESGRAAADVLLDVRNKGNDLIATLKGQGATSAEVQAADSRLRGSFIETAKQMGIGQDEAQKLADQILGIPSERQTTILANTDPAQAALDRLIGNYNGKKLTIDVAARVAGGATVNSLGLAAGGPVHGPGSGTSDSIPAMLSNGEYVINAKATSYNRGLLDAINSGRIATFAAGGPVNWSDYMSTMSLVADASTAGADAGIKGILQQTAQKAAAAASGGVAGSGGLTGAWGSIWQYVKSRVPQARINSTFRAGDPGYHGRGKAIDMGFGSGPGGAGSAGLALINRVLHDGVGRNLAELIYTGIGDDRPDLKNGRPLNYGAATNAQHRNHVHAAVYDSGGILPPGLTVAYNGTGQNEYVSKTAPGGAPAQFTGTLVLSTGEFLGAVQGVMSARDAELARNSRSAL